MNPKPHYLVRTLRDFSQDYSGPLSSLLATTASEVERLANENAALRARVAELEKAIAHDDKLKASYSAQDKARICAENHRPD